MAQAGSTLPIIAVHGGAWDIPDDAVDSHLLGVTHALETGYRILEDGGSALDAVEAAVASMEDDETFDAGIGSFLNEVGEVELDAAIMDGKTLAVGAVAAVRGIPNPVRLARAVLDRGDCVLLVGDGARRFAANAGVRTCAPEALVVARERERFLRYRSDPDRARSAFGDTVGAIAVDASGGMAAANSTGGRPFKPCGRVGDTPIVGAGLFADSTLGAAVATGHGESILRTCLCRDAVSRIASSGPLVAARAAVDSVLARVGGRTGLLVLDENGSIGVAHSTPRMAFSFRRGRDAAVARISV